MRGSVRPGRGVAPREVPLDERIDVAVNAGHPLTTDAAPLYAGKHRLRTGRNQVTFEVRGRPGFISLYPFERRIEAERADNVREIRLSPPRGFRAPGSSPRARRGRMECGRIAGTQRVDGTLFLGAVGRPAQVGDVPALHQMIPRLKTLLDGGDDR